MASAIENPQSKSLSQCFSATTPTQADLHFGYSASLFEFTVLLGSQPYFWLAAKDADPKDILVWSPRSLSRFWSTNSARNDATPYGGHPR